MEPSKVFSAKNSLQRHVNEIHLGFKPFECEQCSYKIGTKHKLDIHIQAKHTGVWRAVYDQSRIFDMMPKPKFTFKKIRPSAKGITWIRKYDFF